MDRRSLVQSLVSALLGGIVGAVVVAAMSSQPKDTTLETQVASLLARSTEQAGKLSRLESASTENDGRILYLENQNRLAVANARAVNDSLQALTKLTGLLTTSSTSGISAYKIQIPAACYGDPAVWTPGMGLYC